MRRQNIREVKDEIISIIIPVYNVERYLKRCLDSVLMQTYSKLEIILVDDGSTDNSGVICDEYSCLDTRIKVIHKKNGGLSSARNEGMRHATGRFVAFLDSDDYIDPFMYETMLDVLMKTKSDMAICGINFVDENGEEEKRFQHVSGENRSTGNERNYICIEKEDIMKQLEERDLITVVQWNKLFYRNKLENCEYPEGRYHEDVYVIHKELYECKRIVYLNNKFYYYVQRKNSIMHTETKKMIQDAIDGYEERIAFFYQKNMLVDAERSVDNLLKYIKWKFEVQSTDNFSEQKKWLGEKFKEKVDKFQYFNKCNDEELMLYENPREYFEYIRKKNRNKIIKEGIMSFLKKIIIL